MAFRKYRGSAKSPISEYEVGQNFIRVRFGKAKGKWKPGKTYQWTEYGVGKENVDQMKKLAEQGTGLRHFIDGTVAGQVSRIY